MIMSVRSFGSDLSLTPSQEGLLRTALTSNNGNGNSQEPNNRPLSTDKPYNDFKEQSNGSMENGANMHMSPTQKTPVSGHLGSFDESPFLDYDHLDDGSFDWDDNGEQLFGDLPGTEFNDDVEHHDKRKASDEEKDEEGSSKRRESEDKTGKKSAQKPGRKPLTGEPTTVRSLDSSFMILPLLTLPGLETQGAKSSCSESIPRTQRAPSERLRNESRRLRKGI